MNIGIVSHINPYEMRSFLNTNQDIPNTNVSSSSVHALIIGLLKLGHHVTVFSHTSIRYVGLKKCRVLYGERIKIYLIPRIPKIDLFVRSFYLPRRISCFIKREIKNLDILHPQWTYENAAATLSFVDYKPVVCSVRDFWIVQTEFINKHSKDLGERVLWNYSNRKLFKKVINCPKINFVANSEYTREMLKDMLADRVIPIIQNPVKGEDIIDQRTFAFNNVFISIAPNVFDKRKNCEALVKAFSFYHRNHPDAKLNIIGAFSKESQDYIRWKENGWLDGVNLCGFLAHDQVIKHLDEASVLIHPSLEETYGNILLEGMARRLLVVGGGNSGAVPYVLGDGRWGVLCDMRDYKSIVSVMEEIFSNQCAYVDIIEKATIHLRNDLTDVAIAKSYINLYNSYL